MGKEVSVVSFYIAIPFFVGIYLVIYQLAVILLFAGTFFKNKVKPESYNLLYVFNTLAAWCSLFFLLALAAEFFMAWYGQNQYEWYAFKENGSWEFWTVIPIINLLSFILGLLLFFRKFRISIWFTLLFFLSNSCFFYERIVIFITSLYRDYLPYSWSAYYENAHPYNLYSFPLIILLLVLIYLRSKKKGRLPFPSVFLK